MIQQQSLMKVADNTGAGGQGSRYGYAPSAGGSGIVIIRYKLPPSGMVLICR